MAAQQRQAKDRRGRFRGAQQLRRAVEVGQRDHVDPGHFRRLPDQTAHRAAPHHHGSDEEAGPRGVVIQSAQDIT